MDPKIYHARPDGEYFTDESQKPTPPRDTWDSLSVNQLLDVQSQLYEKIWAFRTNQAIATQLNTSLQYVQVLISQRNAGL
jgi:hypothetical protein